MIRLTAVSATAIILAAPALAETRTFDVGAFEKIEVSAGLDLVFTTGGDQSVSVEQANGDWDDIVVETRGDTLHLERPRKSGWGWGKRARYTITVSAPVITDLRVSSGADAEGSGMSGERVSIRTSSGSDATVTGISAQKVDLRSSSGSDLTASGTCQTLEADSSSGSDLDAEDLICETVEAEASSGSDIEAHATQAVYADASSGADIDIDGSPSIVETDKSSGGSVSVRKAN